MLTYRVCLGVTVPVVLLALMVVTAAVVHAASLQPDRALPARAGLPEYHQQQSTQSAQYRKRSSALVSTSATTPQAMLFNAVQFLRPLPSSWSATNPLDLWGHGVQVGGCPNPTSTSAVFYSIAFDPQLFSLNKTVRLDLLDPTMPICNITAIPPSVSSSPSSSSLPMILVINFSSIPTLLQVLDAPQSDVFTTSSIGPRYVNLTGTPASVTYMDLSSTGIAGNLDFSQIHWNGISRHFNMSNNPNIIGSVDLLTQGVCNTNFFSIDLQNTGITLVITGIDGQGGSCVGNNPGDAIDGFTIAVLIDVGVGVKTMDASKTFLMDDYYYCMPVGSFGDASTNLPVINVARSNGMDIIRMINPPYECNMVLTARFVNFDEGYIFDSTAYGAQLYPCLNLTVAYAYKMFAPGPMIGIVDAVTNETTVFGFCPDEPGTGEDNYFSVSINENSFMDFYSSGYNVSARAFNPSGVYTTCFFAWHYFAEVGVSGSPLHHTVYNDQKIIADMIPCFPTASADNVTFGTWTSMTLTINKNNVQFHDNLGNILDLERFGYAPIQSDSTYCLVTPTLVYSWQVNKFSSQLTVSTLDGTTIQACTYNGIFQYRTVNGAGINYFYAFDSVISALGPCLPPDASGHSRNWSSTMSRLQLAAGSTTFGDLILTDVNTLADFTFSASSCISNPSNASVTLCSSVDLFTGSLVLGINANRSTNLTYYRQAADHSLQNMTTCVSNAYPLLFDTNGNALATFSSIILADWAPCFPVRSDTTNFTNNGTRLTYDSQTGIVTLQSTLSNGLISAIQLSQSSCTSGIPIQPSKVVMCPELPIESSNKSVTDACIGSMCRPMKSVEWGPSSSSDPWAAGAISVGSDILVSSLSKILTGGGGGVSVGTITACYPDCFVDISQCSQLAFVISQVMMCYISRGQSSGAIIPQIPQHCLTNDALIAVLSMLFAFNDGFPPFVGTQCVDGGAALTTIASTDNNSGVITAKPVFVLATSTGAAGYDTVITDATGTIVSGTSNAAVGLTADCTPCISLWLQKLYPTPLVLIGLNSAFNVFLVIVANYIIEPLIGPRIVKLKVKLLAALGALSRRETHAYEKWLLRCLNPYIASQHEIDYHIDMVCKIVNIERKKLLQSQRGEDLDDDDEFYSNSSMQSNGGGAAGYDGVSPTTAAGGGGQYTTSRSGRLAAPPAADASALHLQQNTNNSFNTPRGSTSRRYSSRLSNQITEETPEQAIESDDKFRTIYATQLMSGTRMLGSVGEISLRKLVELRDSCASRPTPIIRTNYLRFPTKKGKESAQLMTEMTAENLLLSASDKVNDDGANGDYENVSISGDSMNSMFTADLQLEDAIAAMDADTTAEWVPFVLAQEWMDRQFLSPKDWLLFLQLLMVLVLIGRTFDLAIVNSGAVGTWEVYSAFYFLFLNGSAPVSLLVNAVFRALYSKQFSGSATGGHTRFAVFFATLRHLSRDPFFMLPALFMLPAIVSHVIPGLGIFPFLWSVGAVLVAITMATRIKLPEVDELQGKLRTCSLTTIGCIVTRVMFRQMVMFVCVASIQLSFSYTMMFYAAREGTLTSSTGSWIDIVSVDYNARSLVCALVQVRESEEGSWNLFYSQFV